MFTIDRYGAKKRAQLFLYSFSSSENTNERQRKEASTQQNIKEKKRTRQGESTIKRL